MQSLNARHYIYLVLTFLLGGTLILLMEHRHNRHVDTDETPSTPAHIDRGKHVAYVAAENAKEMPILKKSTKLMDLNAEHTKDTILFEKSAQPIDLNSESKTCPHLVKQRNILFAISGILLIASLVLGSIMFVQSQRLGNTQFNTGRSSTQPARANERIFEKGVAFPHFTPTAYGHTDTAWQQGIQEMKVQTSAQWIEIPILFSQATSSDTHVEASSSTPDVATFVEGIQTAHALGYKVFFVPLVTVRVSGGWSGSIDLPTPQLQQAWFDNYWSALKPYAQAAQANNVEQMAVATELQVLQNQVPAEFWNQLFTRVASVFTFTRTYDMNWSSLVLPMPAWLKSPLFDMIGVSSYISLTDVNRPVPAEQIPRLWQERIKNPLDNLSIQFGKRVLITEIGYRNTSDALYQTWLKSTSAPPDPQLQAQAYNATLLNVFSDPYIAGTFFWGWDNADQYTIKGQPAVQVLQNWYKRSI
jgi:Glycoside Hydrolase Family 113